MGGGGNQLISGCRDLGRGARIMFGAAKEEVHCDNGEN
jgi:hypothetical protein